MFNLCGDDKHSFAFKATVSNLDVSCEVPVFLRTSVRFSQPEAL